MQQVFAHQFMHQNRGCYSGEQLGACSFMKGGAVTLDRILRSEISLKDKYWFVCRKLATREENQAIAIRVAEIVMPIYERRCPDDKAPRECIEAAKAFIAGTISIGELLKKRKAAADAATYAAYAAAYADAATYAAYAATDADAYAATYAADAAYAAADVKAELHNYLLTFIGK